MAQRPFAQWVIFLALYAFALYWATGLSFAVTLGTISPALFLGLMVFVALFLVAGALSLRGNRWGFALAAGVCAFFLIFNASFLAASLSDPATVTFGVAMLGFPFLTLVVIFSILAFLNVKQGIAQKRYLASPKSGGGLLTLAVVGFVVGGLVVGTMAATEIDRLIAQSGGANVEIVPNAAATSTPSPFSPATFTVAVGGTVAWFNGDNMQHSVTSDTGLFDSGLLSPGARWSYTFTQPGTYHYHCTPHPWMKGTIVVS